MWLVQDTKTGVEAALKVTSATWPDLLTWMFDKHFPATISINLYRCLHQQLECYLQVQKSAQHYTEAARDEVTLLTQIKDGDPENEKHCVRLYDWFEHSGANGRHICMVFEVQLPLVHTCDDLSQNHYNIPACHFFLGVTPSQSLSDMHPA